MKAKINAIKGRINAKGHDRSKKYDVSKEGVKYHFVGKRSGNKYRFGSKHRPPCL